MSRITADDRVRRLLSIVPWVASRPDGVPIDELCARFDVDRKLLVNDLTTLSFVGVAPYTPDTQVDVVVEDGRVFVHLPQWFDRPLRLTAEQGLALVAAGRSLLSVQGADPDGPLARGLGKLAASLGVGVDDASEALDVRLGDAAAGTVTLLQEAIDAHRQVELDYYAYGRDERTRRVVEPQRLYADQGQWYLAAFCHLAGGDRIFRVDRIRDADLLDATFVPSADPPTLGVFQAAPDDPRVTLDLAADARWVAEQYPTEAVEERPDGRLRVTLAVSARPWLERLLLRLGPEAEVVTADGDLARCGAEAAARVRSRYRDR